MATTVREGSTSWLTVALYDRSGTLAAPTSLTWQAHDVRTNTELQAETSLTPASSVEITIPPAVNTLVNDSYKTEQRRITVIATYGDEDVLTSVYVYELQKLENL